MEPALPLQLVFPKLTTVTKMLKRNILLAASLTGEGADLIEKLDKDKDELLAQHIEIAFSFMSIQWQLENSKISFIDPKLILLCMAGVDKL